MIACRRYRRLVLTNYFVLNLDNSKIEFYIRLGTTSAQVVSDDIGQYCTYALKHSALLGSSIFHILKSFHCSSEFSYSDESVNNSQSGANSLVSL